MTSGHQPLKSFLNRFCAGSGRASGDVHRRAITVASASDISADVAAIEAVYPKLRRLFLATDCAIENLVDLLKKFSIRLAHQSIVQLFVRMQWEIEADNEFSMAMGADTALATQN